MKYFIKTFYVLLLTMNYY